VDYKTKNNIVATGGQLINEQELAQINTALTQARTATAEAQARFDRVTQVLRDDNPDPKAAATATVTESLQNPIITQLRQQYLDLALAQTYRALYDNLQQRYMDSVQQQRFPRSKPASLHGPRPHRRKVPLSRSGCDSGRLSASTRNH
jgi:uncharacterized protein involved in exopolysaccharide biosynthesis